MGDTLSFSLTNLGKSGTDRNKNLIYVKSAGADNNLLLHISVGTEVTGIEKGNGEAVPLDKASHAEGSLIYLALSELGMSSGELEDLQVAVDTTRTPKYLQQWVSKVYSDTGNLCLAATADVDDWEPSDQLVISIKNMSIESPPSGASVDMTAYFYRFPPITILPSIAKQISTTVSLQVAASAGADLHNDVGFDVNQNSLLTPSKDGTLNFRFKPQGEGRGVPVSSKSHFIVNFHYAADAEHGDGALTTVADAALQKMQINPVTSSGWGIEKASEAENVSWKLTPPSSGHLLQGGVVEFEVVGIETDFPAGPTMILVSWDSDAFSGYKGGTFYGVLDKVAKADISKFDVSPNPAVYDVHGYAEVTATWKTQNANRITLNPGGIDVTHLRSKTMQLSSDTSISLVAEGPTVGDQDNSDQKIEDVVVFPAINSFKALPSSVYYEQFDQKTIMLSWDVDAPAASVEIISSTGSEQPGSAGKVNFPYGVSGPQLLTLQAGTGEEMLERKVYISAFEPRLTKETVDTAIIDLAASPAAPFLAAVTASGLMILDTFEFKPISSTIALGSNPSGVAFSEDGSTIFVANSGSGDVSVISVGGTQGQPTFSPEKVSVGGKPQKIAFVPGSEMAIVTTQNENFGEVVFLAKTRGRYTRSESLTVGSNPVGVGVAPSGGSAYVANSGDDTVSVLVRSGSGFVLGQKISGYADLKSPVGVAVSADSKTVLVSCSEGAKVLAFDYADPSAVPPFIFNVGGTPQQIVVLASGGYAFVGNQQKKISLLSTSGGPSACRLVDATVQVAPNPSGISATPEGNMVLVGGASLSVVSLDRYVSSSQPLGLPPGYPANGLTQSSNHALIWSNLLTNNSGPPEQSPTQVYTFTKLGASLTKVQALEGNHYIAMNFLPDDRWVAAALFRNNGGSEANELQLLDREADYAVKAKHALPDDEQHQQSAAALTVDSQGRIYALTYMGQAPKSISLAVYKADTLNSSPKLSLISNTSLYTWGEWAPQFPCVVSEDGSRFYAIEGAASDSTLHIVTGASGSSPETSSMSLGSGSAIPVKAVLDPSGEKLYVLFQDGEQMSVITVTTATLSLGSPVLFPYGGSGDQIYDLTIMPDGSSLIVPDSQIGGVRFLDPVSLAVVGSIPVSTKLSNLMAVSVAPDASEILVAGKNNAVDSGVFGRLPAVQSVSRGDRGQGLQAGGPPGHDFTRTPMHVDFASALGDTEAYSGIGQRVELGLPPGAPVDTGFSGSPDLITYGLEPAKDPTQTFLQAGNSACQIDGANCNKTVEISQINYVYMRGKNLKASEQKGTMTLFYVESDLMMFPGNWRGDRITTADGVQNWMVVDAPASDWAVTSPPFAWDVPEQRVGHSGGDHYCLVGFSEPGDTGAPFDLQTLPGYNNMTFSELVNLVQSRPDMVWRNTVDQQPSDGDGVHWLTHISAPDVAGQLHVTLSYSGFPDTFPSDWYFQVIVPGPDKSYYINTGKVKMTSSGGSWIKNWKANFDTYAEIRVWAGASPLPTDGRIILEAFFPGGGPPMAFAVEESEVATEGRMEASLADVELGSDPMILIGSVHFRVS